MFRVRHSGAMRLFDPVNFSCIAPGGGDLIKLDIINEVVNRTGISKAKAESAVETVFERMKEALSRGERIEFRGFGVFAGPPRTLAMAPNPRPATQAPLAPGKPGAF